jgi:hypothetical protein
VEVVIVTSVFDSLSPRNPTPRPLVRADLDEQARRGCTNPDCREKHDALEAVNLVAGCHPGAGVSVRYSTLRRTVFIRCTRCRRPLAEVAVADVWAGDSITLTTEAGS